MKAQYTMSEFGRWLWFLDCLYMHIRYAQVHHIVTVLSVSQYVGMNVGDISIIGMRGCKF